MWKISLILSFALIVTGGLLLQDNDDVFKLLTAIGFHPRGDGYDFNEESFQRGSTIELMEKAGKKEDTIFHDNDDEFKYSPAMEFHPRMDYYDFKKEASQMSAFCVVNKKARKKEDTTFHDNDDELKLSPAIEFYPRSDGYDFKKESFQRGSTIELMEKAGKKEDTIFHGLSLLDNDDRFKLWQALEIHPKRDFDDFKKDSSQIRAFVESIKKAGIKKDTTFHVSELMFQKSIGSLKVIGTTAFIVLFVFAMRIVNQKELMTETLPQSQTMTIATKELRSHFPTQVGDEVDRQCKMCISHSPAVAHCQTCQLNICTACNNLHKRVWTLLKHNVCPLNNI